MRFANKKTLFACTLASLLLSGYAAASGMQAADQAAPPPTQGDASHDRPNFFSQHFSTDALSSDVKSSVLQANLAPVMFSKITVHTRDKVTSSGQSTPTDYTVTVLLENAGHGLIRRMQSVQGNEGNTITRFDLTYRGYFPFLTQSIPANANALPPVIEARKVLRFDTHTDAHFNFSYLYGPSGHATFADPGQVICDAGKEFSASDIHPAIQGQARELNCQNVDSNGIVTDKMKFAYLEKYGVALMLHTQNPESSLESTIADFSVE
jgi:hypothetical protein